jgi:hypothetical protein
MLRYISAILNKSVNSFRKHIFVGIFLLIALTIIRNGFSIYGLMWRDFEGGKSYKTNDSSLQMSFMEKLRIPNLLMELGNQIGAKPYFLLHTIFVLFCVAIILRQISYIEMSFKLKLKLVLVLSYLPAVTIIFQRFGTFDTICLLMSVIGVLAKTTIGSFIAALLFASTNAEGSLVSGLSLLILHYTILFGVHRGELKFPTRSASFGLFQVMFSVPFILSQFSRPKESVLYSIFLVDSKNAIAQLIASGLLLLFSWLGPLWILLHRILSSISSSLSDKLILVFLFIGCGTLIASDGTRNSALGLTSMTVCLFFSNVGRETINSLGKSVFILFYIMPAVNIANFNLVLPFYQVLYLFDLARPYLITN